LRGSVRTRRARNAESVALAIEQALELNRRATRAIGPAVLDSLTRGYLAPVPDTS